MALMAEVLVGREVPPENIAVLTADPALLPPQVSHVLPTRKGIRQAMASAAEASLPGNTVVFYFSGHETQVVGISDACHSGTGFRAGPEAGAARVVDPALLDIPDEAPGPGAVDRRSLSGDDVLLYSSRSDQRSYEYPLDPTDPAGRLQGGVTPTVTRALHRGTAQSGAGCRPLQEPPCGSARRRRTPMPRGRSWTGRCSGGAYRSTDIR